MRPEGTAWLNLRDPMLNLTRVLEGGGSVQGLGSLSASILGPAIYFRMNMDLGADRNFK